MNRYEVEHAFKLTKHEHASLAKQFKNISGKEKKFTTITYLFREPAYIRIRYIKGSKTATITNKVYLKTKNVREETEFQMQRKDLGKFAKMIKELGVKEGVHVEITCKVYTIDGLEFKLAHGVLGHTLDIEGIATNRKEASQIKKKIETMITRFKLDKDSYSKFTDKEKIFKKISRPITSFKELRILNR
jgi:adenylate cyclase class IV